MKFALVALAITCFLLLDGAVESDPTGPATLGLLFILSLTVFWSCFIYPRKDRQS